MHIEAPDRPETQSSRCGRDCATCPARLCAPDKADVQASGQAPSGLDKAPPSRSS